MKPILVALFFLAAQVAPALHEALEGGHDAHACCTDVGTTHIDTCGPEHDAGPCQVCAATRAPVSDVVPSDTLLPDRVNLPEVVPLDSVRIDPFLVHAPDTRGPPA